MLFCYPSINNADWTGHWEIAFEMLCGHFDSSFQVVGSFNLLWPSVCLWNVIFLILFIFPIVLNVTPYFSLLRPMYLVQNVTKVTPSPTRSNLHVYCSTRIRQRSLGSNTVGGGVTMGVFSNSRRSEGAQTSHISSTHTPYSLVWRVLQDLRGVAVSTATHGRKDQPIIYVQACSWHCREEWEREIGRTRGWFGVGGGDTLGGWSW